MRGGFVFGCARVLQVLVTWAGILAGLWPTGLYAEAPVIEAMFPMGGRIGSVSKVVFTGKFGAGPVRGWAERPGIEFKGAGSNGVFEVVIGTNVSAGPCVIRLFNADGASRPRIFMVGKHPEMTEVEPNDSAGAAQMVAGLPASIHGRFDKPGDVDSYAVKLAAGQTLVAEVVANMAGSSIDPVINLRDADGNKAAFAHDGYGLDPLLVFPVTKSGTYVLQVSGFAYPPAADVRFVGGKNQHYRLSITAGPYVRYAFPAGIPRGAATVQLHGWNLGGTNGWVAQSVPESATTGRVDFVEITPTGLPHRLRLVVGDGPELAEVEPNDLRTNAQKVLPPVTVNGRIGGVGDVDRFRFSARKGERLDIKLLASSLGAPMDGLLVVEDAGGKELARVDDSGGDFDARLSWTAPADGEYLVGVRDLFGKGGPDYVYRLEMGPPVAGFTVAAENHAFAVQVGKTNELKLTVTPVNGYNCTNLTVTVEGLPEGVVARVPPMVAKGGEVKVVLVASPEAEPSNQPIRVLVGEGSGKGKSRSAVFAVNAKDTSPELWINHTDTLWLTVTAGPALASPVIKKKKK